MTGSSEVRLLSRADPGDLSEIWPRLRRLSLDGLGAHQLYVEPEASRALTVPIVEHLARRSVLNALGGPEGTVARNLASLPTRQVVNLDPPALPNDSTHICTQWQRQVERSGILLDKCAYRTRDFSRRKDPLDRVFEEGETNRTACVSGQGLVRAEVTTDRAAGLSVVIHPGSGSRAKCWPLDAYQQVARRLVELNACVTLIVGPTERERWTPEAIDEARLVCQVRECGTGDELQAVLRSADAYLGNDSGPTHLAALLGVPTIALFGPTPMSVWKPLGPTVVALQGTPQVGPTWGLDAADISCRLLGLAIQQG